MHLHLELLTRVIRRIVPLCKIYLQQMINRLKGRSYLPITSNVNPHVTSEGRVIQEELVYIIGDISHRVRHSDIDLDRFSQPEFHQHIVIQAHHLVSHIMREV